MPVTSLAWSWPLSTTAAAIRSATGRIWGQASFDAGKLSQFFIVELLFRPAPAVTTVIVLQAIANGLIRQLAEVVNQWW